MYSTNLTVKSMRILYIDEQRDILRNKHNI